MAKIIHNGQGWPIPEGSDADTAFAGLKALMPALENATIKKQPNGDYRVEKHFGKKG